MEDVYTNLVETVGAGDYSFLNKLLQEANVILHKRVAEQVKEYMRISPELKKILGSQEYQATLCSLQGFVDMYTKLNKKRLPTSGVVFAMMENNLAALEVTDENGRKVEIKNNLNLMLPVILEGLERQQEPRSLEGRLRPGIDFVR